MKDYGKNTEFKIKFNFVKFQYNKIKLYFKFNFYFRNLIYYLNF
jgi:hypothetical protein